MGTRHATGRAALIFCGVLPVMGLACVLLAGCGKKQEEAPQGAGTYYNGPMVKKTQKGGAATGSQDK